MKIKTVNGITRYTAESNEEWRKERANSIGASAVGTILGENAFSTPLALAQKMRAELNGDFDYTQNMAMMRGHAYEPGVATLFEWQTGHQVISASSAEYLLRREDIPFMHASPDRTYWIDENGLKHGVNAEQNKGILECKTTRMKVDCERLPTSWFTQLQVQMGISGYHHGFIAWDTLTEREGFGFHYFDFIPEFFDSIVEVCRDFWYRCVIGGEDPEPLNTSDLLSLYPTHVPGKTVTVGSDLRGMIVTLKDMKAAKSELELEIDAMSDKVKVAFEDAEALVDADGNVLATYKAGKPRVSVDSKKLKEEYPDVYGACTKTTAATRTLLLK